MAGIIYRFNLFQVQQWLKLPDSLTSAVSRTVGNMFSSDNPPTQPYAMGATLEIQRLQQIEHYEQQAMRARMGHLRNRVLMPACFCNNRGHTLYKPYLASHVGQIQCDSSHKFLYEWLTTLWKNNRIIHSIYLWSITSYYQGLLDTQTSIWLKSVI